MWGQPNPREIREEGEREGEGGDCFLLQVITEKWSRSGTLVWHEEHQRPALKVPTWFTAVHIATELQTTQNSQNQLIHVKTPDKFEASHACGMDAGRYTI